MTKLFVYRCFDSAGVLLYVGLTGDPRRRIWAHRNATPWWHEVASTTTEKFASTAEASRAERRAIIWEAPKYNKLHRVSDQYREELCECVRVLDDLKSAAA